MNIVIPFRNTCGTDELDMCIKLIKKNLKINYDNIYIIGDEVNQFKDSVINIVVNEQKYNKWLDSNFLVKTYIETIGNPFILFNDDFFLTENVDNIPCYYFDTLQNRSLTTYIINEKINKLKLSAYGLNIDSFLKRFGNFENYEVHIPMIIDYPSVMYEAIEQCNINDCPALKRTMYIKLCEEKNFSNTIVEIKHDVKFNEPLRVMQYPFFSLTDRAEFDVFRDTLEEIAKQ